MEHILLLPFYLIGVATVLLAIDEFIGWLKDKGGK